MKANVVSDAFHVTEAEKGLPFEKPTSSMRSNAAVADAAVLAAAGSACLLVVAIGKVEERGKK